MFNLKTLFFSVFFATFFAVAANADVYQDCKDITEDCDARVACQLVYAIMDATSGKSVDYDMVVVDAIMDIPACENYANSFTHNISIPVTDDLQINISWDNVKLYLEPAVLLFAPANLKNLTSGDIIIAGNMPDQFFSEQCSPHRNIAKNKNNSTPVNIAGRKLFLDSVSNGKFKNTDTQFVITNADGGVNTFTGLVDASLFRGVLSYRPSSKSRENVNDILDKLPVVFSNYKEAYTQMTALAKELKGSACSGLLLFLASPIDIVLNNDHTQSVIKQDRLLIRSTPVIIQ